MNQPYKINPKEILNTGMFDFEKAEQNAGWIEELNKEEHTPESEEYGLSSFVYRTKNLLILFVFGNSYNKVFYISY